MGVKIVRQATCDRCGRQCSGVYEKVLSQDVCDEYKLTKNFTENFYHYTEMILNAYDNRFESGIKEPIILCGKCVDKLSEWLKEDSQRTKEHIVE